jgi:anti-sigma factor RsiW
MNRKPDRGDVEELLYAWADGELTAEEQRELERLLAESEEARSERRRLETLRDAVRSLPPEVPPRRDLWPELRARLERETDRSAPSAPAERGAGPLGVTVAEDRFAAARASRRRSAARPLSLWRWGALAAALVMAAGLFLVLGPEPAPEGPEAAALEATRTELREARGAVLAELEDTRPTWSPEVAEVISANLAVVDEAVAEVERDVIRHPDDPHLRLLLADRYRQQANLLRRLQRRAAFT